MLTASASACRLAVAYFLDGDRGHSPHGEQGLQERGSYTVCDRYATMRRVIILQMPRQCFWNQEANVVSNRVHVWATRLLHHAGFIHIRDVSALLSWARLIINRRVVWEDEATTEQL